ncbi:aldolase [Microlunatus sp. GCM10028923]|uniref:aldolase n=1 Tax=Microlunatus sp. GCM10028923 TaxID=3273400 RepID=UPI0036181DE0
MPDPSRPPTLTAIARPSGALAMVAMDQRDSLTTMFAAAGVQAGHADLVDFKIAVARALGPLASGFLIDHAHGFDRVRDERLLPDTAGLILAADELDQQPGGPVDDTDLDAVVLADDFDLTGVSAIKLLLIWRDDERRAARVELARRFTAAAAERGLLSVLEPVVQPARGQEADFDREQAIRTAAGELSVVGQSLYKVQVPLFGKADGDDLDRACAALNDCITGPWVVLSQGVAAADFADAVAAACRAGASGFLAGRALWADVVGRADLVEALQEVSVPRLQKLITIVDELATPWDAR